MLPSLSLALSLRSLCLSLLLSFCNLENCMHTISHFFDLLPLNFMSMFLIESLNWNYVSLSVNLHIIHEFRLGSLIFDHSCTWLVLIVAINFISWLEMMSCFLKNSFSSVRVLVGLQWICLCMNWDYESLMILYVEIWLLAYLPEWKLVF